MYVCMYVCIVSLQGDCMCLSIALYNSIKLFSKLASIMTGFQLKRQLLYRTYTYT